MKDGAVKILQGAKAILQKRGWYQGGMEASSTGPCCLLHAIEAAAGRQGDYYASTPSTPIDQAYQTVLAVTGAEPDHLGKWNDDPKRTKEEIFDALDNAILRIL